MRADWSCLEAHLRFIEVQADLGNLDAVERMYDVLRRNTPNVRETHFARGY